MNELFRIGWNFKTHGSFTRKEYKSIFTSLKENAALCLCKGCDESPSLWRSKARDYNIFIMPSGHIQIQTFLSTNSLCATDTSFSFSKAIAIFIENNFNFELLTYIGCYFNRASDELGHSFIEETSLLLKSQATFLFSSAPEIILNTGSNITYYEVIPPQNARKFFSLAGEAL